MSEKRTSPLTLLIVGGMFVLALAAILVFGFAGGESKSTKRSSDNSSASSKKKEPPRDLTAGQTITREEVEEQGVELALPAAPVDTNRIAMTYKKGKTYKTKIKTSIETRGSYQDWGITTEMNMFFLGEFEFMRDIEENDGNRMVVMQEFTKLECIELFTKVDSISLNLGNVAHTVLDLAGATIDIPPGSSRVATDQLNKILASDMVKSELAKAIRDDAAQLFTEIDSLNGKKCRIVYENGKGVVSVQPIGCTLTNDEYTFIMDMAMMSDVYIMPEEECNEGDTWEIRGEDFLPIIDPSLRASLSGTLTARRGKDGGDSRKPTGIIKLERGMLEMRDRDEGMEVAARWAPRGDLEYSFSDQIITSGRLGGDLSIVSRSLDHIVFEMRNVVTPKYEITYHCEILE